MKYPLKSFLVCMMLLSSGMYLKAQQQFIGIKLDAGSTPQLEGKYNGFATVGFSYNYQAKSRFTFGAELLFERRAYADDKFVNAFYSIDRIYSSPYIFNSLKIPFLAGYIFGNKFFAHPSVGVAPGILVEASSGYDPGRGNQPDYSGYVARQTISTWPLINKFNLFLLADVTLGYRISQRLDLTLSTSLNDGITPVLKSNSTLLWGENIYLGLGVRYCLTK